jgi:queuosine biosynthesis protein QueC
MKNAIILCSGGLDSVVTAFYAKKILKRRITILFFNYGQRNLKQEKTSAKYFAKKLNSKFIEIKIPKLNFSECSLTTRLASLDNNQIKMKDLCANNLRLRAHYLGGREGRTDLEQNKRELSPQCTSNFNLKNTKAESDKWYVPQRNLIFISIASAIAESLAIKNNSKYEIFVGFKNEGKEPFPDTTEQFVKNFNQLIKNSSKNKISLTAPLIKKDKEDIIQLGEKLQVELEKTFSCYAPIKNKHCGFCLACRLRQAGFYWTNIPDKTNYKK